MRPQISMLISRAENRRTVTYINAYDISKWLSRSWLLFILAAFIFGVKDLVRIISKVL